MSTRLEESAGRLVSSSLPLVCFSLPKIYTSYLWKLSEFVRGGILGCGLKDKRRGAGRFNLPPRARRNFKSPRAGLGDAHNLSAGA
jgi:hypothetical protein